MNVVSTRGHEPITLAAAIAKGQAPDGGLYMPQSIPVQTGPWGTSLVERTTHVLQPFFAGDELAPHLEAIVSESLCFDAPITWIDEHTALLELFGSCCAPSSFGCSSLTGTCIFASLTAALLLARSDSARLALRSSWCFWNRLSLAA